MVPCLWIWLYEQCFVTYFVSYQFPRIENDLFYSCTQTSVYLLQRTRKVISLHYKEKYTDMLKFHLSVSVGCIYAKVTLPFVNSKITTLSRLSMLASCNSTIKQTSVECVITPHIKVMYSPFNLYYYFSLCHLLLTMVLEEVLSFSFF